ncbi:LacI family DNA-binding transcriptional regulator [Sinomonas sp. ASV322]|uniref:LacI family DNA-binding transcriptional regulator n=1 Tax=Sinomonas sp. ASV322 TaxID=3041920 RepID=UPI0027DE30A5|nr:LacI family DNA-binding transcriptional regulator [Sinomonas sp. ASV322]MDQ4504569.1 LacI family DNA-binding transcriptional regulator [Sinomonas sp. ASV322]
MAPPVTLLDLARELGLSKSTVSEALQESSRVAPATRERVREAAARLGYTTNRAARSLRRSSTGALGLYIPQGLRSSVHFYMEFAFGVADEAAAQGYDLTLFASSPERAASHGFQVDGAIIVDVLGDDLGARRLVRTDIPIVSAGRPVDEFAERIAADVSIDHAAGARRILDAMASSGAGRPALITSGPEFQPTWVVDVERAYTAWCAEHGIPEAQLSVTIAPAEHELRTAVERALALPGLGGIVCAEQGLAGRCIGLLEQLGRAPGRDLQLASLAGDPTTELPDARIWAMDLRPREFGAEAVRLLLDVIAAPALRGSHRTHAAELVAAGAPSRG